MRELYELIFESSGEAMFFVDRKLDIVRVNRAFGRVTGYGEADAVGLPLEALLPDPGDPPLWPSTAKTAAGSEDGRQGWVPIVFGDGERGLTEVHVHKVPESAGVNASSFFLLRQAYRRDTDYDGSSFHRDSLTGLPGPELFSDRLEQAVRSAIRERRSVALLMVGLDRFSFINDAMGVGSGDLILRSVAHRLREHVRRSDTVARIKGDCFAILTNIISDNHAVIVAEKVLGAIVQPLSIDGQDVTVKGSIGITVSPLDGEGAESLLNNAERAMHHSKRNGGNCYEFFSTEMSARARHRLQMETSLRRALSEEEFILHYQPKVDIETERIVGAESLVRWQDPARGLVAPMDFIPLAEETGLIVDIGAWTLREACRQNKAWQDEGLRTIPLAVNISGRQFQSPDLKKVIENALDESGLDPKYLELEITESMLLTDIDKTIDLLRQLSALNLVLAIDDFGTGYSNLSYLNKFPVSSIKIDRCFVQGVEEESGMAEISRAIIALSKGLKLEVIAEGAESREQVSFLREHGCRTVQGFFYSRPLPAKEFAALLKTGASGGLPRSR